MGVGSLSSFGRMEDFSFEWRSLLESQSAPRAPTTICLISKLQYRTPTFDLQSFLVVYTVNSGRPRCLELGTGKFINFHAEQTLLTNC